VRIRVEEVRERNTEIGGAGLASSAEARRTAATQSILMPMKALATRHSHRVLGEVDAPQPVPALGPPPA